MKDYIEIIMIGAIILIVIIYLIITEKRKQRASQIYLELIDAIYLNDKEKSKRLFQEYSKIATKKEINHFKNEYANKIEA